MLIHTEFYELRGIEPKQLNQQKLKYRFIVLNGVK